MNNNEVKRRLQMILTDPERMSLRIDDELDGGTSMLVDLALDSIQILELIVGIEKEFDIAIDTDEIDLDIFNRVDAVVAFIRNLICAKAEVV